jgi:hypothetical protein
VGRDEEKDIEQRGSCKGGCLLVRLHEGGEGESWQVMPQVKGLKELKLPVGNEMVQSRYGGRSKIEIGAISAFFGQDF